MSLTVVVKSCQRDRDLGFHDAIRFTWGKDLRALGVDLVFVTAGINYTRASDEVNFVDCADDYAGLPEKTKRICNWAYLRRWGHIFLCDNDTLPCVDKLLALPFEDFDYAGGFKGGQAEIGKQFTYTDYYIKKPATLWPWASGGYGYFLSPKAQAAVAGSSLALWAEDMQVGQVMGPRSDLKVAAFPMTKVTTHIPKTDGWSPEILKKWYHESK